ncbi:MAG: transporter substrate-binding domain-containing protein [Myxococcota bacterium]
MRRTSLRRTLPILPLLAVLLVWVAPGCTGGRLALPGDLRVGLHTDYPPLSFEKNGEIVGIEPDLARMVGRELQRRVRFVPLERAELIDALEDDRIDVIMTGMSVTAERSRRVRFIEPYSRVGQMAILRRDRIAELGRPGDLARAGARVAFVEGTTGAIYVRGHLSRAQWVPFASVAEAEAELRAGSIDYLVHDAPTAWRLGMDLRDGELIGLYRPLTEEWLAWAVRPGDDALARSLDALSRRWRGDGSIDRVVNAWVPVRITQ